MQIELDDLLMTIDQAMGEPQCRLQEDLDTPANREVLAAFLASEAFAEYVEDNTHRTIIRHYLLNAIIQGHFGLSQLAEVEDQLGDADNRAALALSMLVSATADAEAVFAEHYANKLNPLEKSEDFHIHLVDIDPPDDLH
ncbi:MAG: hypothetical protein CSA53_05130 [Gammaproteobacteria bacterium]|nr:MAG: hypothetical protein CSA53_05130 [Gammaproteobacteria bacterium]